jgi:hypothetical protein
LPGRSDVDKVVKALIDNAYQHVPPKGRPSADLFFPINDLLASAPVPILFSDHTHPAAQPGYLDALPTQRATVVEEEDKTSTYFCTDPQDRWYVVIRGVDYHGVVHGSALYASMVQGHKGAKGTQVPTRADAEQAYRTAVARGEVGALELSPNRQQM